MWGFSLYRGSLASIINASRWGLTGLGRSSRSSSKEEELRVGCCVVARRKCVQKVLYSTAKVCLFWAEVLASTFNPGFRVIAT